MNGGGGGITVEGVFRDFKGRRAGIIKALTSDVEEFFRQCHPDKESLCLYGFPCGQWGVSHSPAEELPPELPQPALGINFARDVMQKKEDWLSLIAIYSDSWLLSVAFYFGARFGFGESDRKRLFNMINDLPTIFEARMAGASKKQTKEEKSASNHSGNESASSHSSNNL